MPRILHILRRRFSSRYITARLCLMLIHLVLLIPLYHVISYFYAKQITNTMGILFLYKWRQFIGLPYKKTSTSSFDPLFSKNPLSWITS